MTDVKQYRKKPVVIHALQYTGDNVDAVREFGFQSHIHISPKTGSLIVPTLEGEHVISVGDFVIAGVQGEHYACKPDIFAQTYEEVE
jgi:hypothetical protein